MFNLRVCIRLVKFVQQFLFSFFQASRPILYCGIVGGIHCVWGMSSANRAGQPNGSPAAARRQAPPLTYQRCNLLSPFMLPAHFAKDPSHRA